MPEIRFNITDKLNKRILEIANQLGIDKSEYLKSMIIDDLKKRLKYEK